MKEEFKAFVRKKPELARYVNEGKSSWQKIYEQWNLYGEENEVWNDFSKETNKNSVESSLNFSSVGNIIKNIDMASLQKGVNSLQKIIELLQGFTLGSESNKTDSYKTRQLFKKFED
mgnify:CR=1 FL=1